MLGTAASLSVFRPNRAEGVSRVSLEGAGVDHEELFAHWRVLARRDAGLAAAHGATCLGAAPVWLAGGRRLAAELAEAVSRGDRGGLAAVEPEYGAGPGHAEVLAERVADGYRLTGSTWPLANATGAQFITVLARTGRPGDTRGYSLLLVRRDEQPSPLTEIPSHGLHGADVSGIDFAGTLVPGSALIGEEGGGVEALLRTLQLNRSVSSAFSLGAGEHALRLVAASDALRDPGSPLIEQRFVRSALARCAGLLAATEACALLTARSAHCLTGELSVLSAAVKGLTQTVVDTVLAELADLLALCAEPSGIDVDFQRIRRDHQVLAFLDGSTTSARNALIRRFPLLVSGFLHGKVDRPNLARAVDLGTKVGPLDRSRITHRSILGCSAVQSLPELARHLPAEAGDGSAASALVRHARELTWLADELHARCAEVAPGPFPGTGAYDLAAAYELLYAGAAVLHLWRSGAVEHDGHGLWHDALWARVALAELNLRLRHRIGLTVPPRDDQDERAVEEFADRLIVATEAGAPLTPFGHHAAPGEEQP